MVEEDKLKEAIAAVTKALETQFPGITVVSSSSAPASGSDADLYIRPPVGQDPSRVHRVTTEFVSKYNDLYGVWILPVLEPQAKPDQRCEIRVKSERMRPTRDYPKGGWLPKAEVWVYGGDSVTVTPVEPKGIKPLRTREEADDKARRTAQEWIGEKFGRRISAP